MCVEVRRAVPGPAQTRLNLSFLSCFLSTKKEWREKGERRGIVFAEGEGKQSEVSPPEGVPGV